MPPALVIDDAVFGRQEIASPALRECIESSPVQRLKGIADFGLPDDLYHIDGFSRYDHSVGVMLALRMFGASEEEQIAGLLHDISHTAFSHLIDFLVNTTASEDFQDSQHERVLEDSVLPGILKRHGYKPARFHDLKRFSLLEQPLPNLCADRIDYALREFPPEVSEECLKALAVLESRFVFLDAGAARLFARHFLILQREHWAGFEAVSRYKIFSDLLRHALERKIVVFDDFWGDDQSVLRKLTASGDEEVARVFSIFRKRTLRNFPRSGEIAVKKFRFVDPEIVLGEKTFRLTEIDPEYEREIAEAREENKRGVRVAVI